MEVGKAVRKSVRTLTQTRRGWGAGDKVNLSTKIYVNTINGVL